MLNRGLRRAIVLPVALAIIGAIHIADPSVERPNAHALHERRESSGYLPHGGCRNFPGGSACFAPGTPEAAIGAALRRLPSGAAGYSAVNRWTDTATNGAISNGPITLTYSFVPDINTGTAATSNSIHAMMDGKFGSRAVWKNLFAEIFAEWSAVSGITYVEVPNDDGAAWPDSEGVLGVRGDVRIVAQPIDGALNTLAFNYFPNSGDMTLDTAEDWADATDDYRFLKNTLLHELGHGLGLEHVNPRNSTKLMEALLNLNFAGPQDDDIRGAQGYYGDPREPNNTLATAEPVGAYAPGATFGELSLHGSADVDYLRITANQGQSIDFTAAPVGSSYVVGPDPGTTSLINTQRIQRLRLRIYTSDGATLLDDESAGSLGTGVTASGTVPAGQSALLAVVSSAAGSDAPQRYALSVAQGAAALVTLQVSTDAPAAVSATFNPPDDNGVSNAALPASPAYFQGTSVQFTAPASSGGVAFSRWSIDGAAQAPGLNPISLTVVTTHNIVARYSNTLVVGAGNDVSTNLGAPVTLTASAAGGSGTYSYSWSPAGGLSATSGATVSATPGATTTYSVTVTDALGASATDDVVVTVIQPLTANAGPDQLVGAGTSGAMAGSASGGVAPYTYAWAPATGLANISNPTTPFSIFVARTYTLTVTDAVGATASDVVTLAPAPALTLSAGVSAATIAAGGSAVLSATVGGGAPPYAIEWSASGVSVGDGASITVSPEATTIYNVSVSDAAGQSTSAAVTVAVASGLSVSILGPSSAVAAGSSVSLSAVVSGGVSPFSYSWTPASQVSSATAAATAATVSANTTFAVDVTDALGQTASASLAVSVGSAVGGQGTDDGADDGGVNGGGAIVPMMGPCGLSSLSLIGFAAMSLVKSRRSGARARLR